MAMKAALVLLTLSCLSCLEAQTLEHVSISQLSVEQSKLTAYLDVRGANDKPSAGLQPSCLQPTLDGKRLPVESLRTFQSTNEGIAYIFLVDVSKSESKSEFTELTKALESFVDHLHANDQAAILTFGERTKIAAQYSSNKQSLKKVIAKLANNDHLTHLNEGLAEALNIAKRKDANLPVRRSIVILSDGKDEGSGFTTDDVLRKFKETRIPIYAIGASSLSHGERARYLEVLHRFALLSGGAYYEAKSGTVGTAYAQIRDRVSSVWEVILDCGSCPADGRSYLLQIQVTEQGQTLADEIEVAPVRGSLPATPHWWQKLGWIEYVAAGIVLLIIGSLILISRKKEHAPPAAIVEERSASPPLRREPMANEAMVTTGPIIDTRSGLEFELIRRDHGRSVDSVYSGTLVDQLVIGRATGAGLRLPDSQISAQHCKLEMVEGHVLLSDLGSTFGTALNGIPIKVRQRLESGDMLSIGGVDFRIRFQA
jgi:Mg-chelatase subunit ChlD